MLAINLTNKVAVVTGVTSGIGAGVAKVLAQAGCHVAGCALSADNDEGTIAFVDSVESFGRRSFYQYADVTKPEELASFIDGKLSPILIFPCMIDILMPSARDLIFEVE